MASKAQRAVTGVPPERWAQFGKALQDWREDVLGCKTRAGFVRDAVVDDDGRRINIRLVQDLEKNARQSYTKWAFGDAGRAYQVTKESMLAFLHGETDTLERAGHAPAPAVQAGALLFPRALPPSPFADPARTAAARPYAAAIWERVLDLPHRVTDPSAAHLGLAGDDAKIWDGTASLPLGDRVWAVADVQRREAGRAREPEGDAAGA